MDDFKDENKEEEDDEKHNNLEDKEITIKKNNEHPLGEHPSRTLFVRNISSNLTDDDLKKYIW